jgi:hypothetical protein
MNIKSMLLTLALLFVPAIIIAQSITIRGYVTDSKRNGLFAVNVYLLNQNSIGTVTNLDGSFTLLITNKEVAKGEQMIFSFLGYKQVAVLLDSIDFSIPFRVILAENTQSLDEIIVEGNKSISREFSIKELDKMKIYLSPLASGDPLKAIAMLPSSTNTNETANPELRGSDANRTKVFFNGVPVSNPVRNSQINGIGFFSLFNPEMIKEMAVYPSNPPLTYGNTSAGMIDIETNDKLEKNNHQVSISLASLGMNISYISSKKSFLQLYGNYQFADAFLKINPELGQHLNDFNSIDFGLNFHSNISPNITFNLYNYIISESSNVLLNLFTWEDHAKAITIRDFSIINLKYQKGKNSLWFNVGSNFSRSHFSFGNITSSNSQQQCYFSLNYKHLFSDNLSLQTGTSNDFGKYLIGGDNPVYYYALAPDAPSYPSDTAMKNWLTEGYIYLRYKAFSKLIFGAGLRNNFNYHLLNYSFFQVNIRYNLQDNQSVLLSGGKYHNVSEPSYHQKEFRLLQSKQLAFEYLFETKRTNINMSAYYKQESGDTSGQTNINGIEFYLEHTFGHVIKTSISNTFLNSEIESIGHTYHASNDFGYYLVATLSYYHPFFFNLSISWTTRKGKYYTPVNSAEFNSNAGFYQPFYSENLNSQRLDNYNTINLSINKLFSIYNGNLIVFASVFNLFNTQNPKGLIYNPDYSKASFDYYQKRSVYFGCVFSW